jgi:hypothetical protein
MFVVLQLAHIAVTYFCWFLFFKPTVDSKKLLAIKTEGTLKANACLFEGHLKSMTPEQTETSGQPPKPQEITPMEVTSNPTQTDVFKVLKR